MPIVIAIGIANLWVGSGGGSTPPVGVCFADTDWNIYDTNNWNDIDTNWDDCPPL